MEKIPMRKNTLFPALIAFFAIFTALRAIPSDQAAIAAVTPGSLSLQQGGPAATIAVNGKRLETVLSAFAVRNNRRVREIAVRLVPPWPASGKVELRAGAGAPVAQGYQLRVSGKAGLREYQFDVPLSVFSLEVKTKPVMQAQLAPPPFPNRTLQNEALPILRTAKPQLPASEYAPGDLVISQLYFDPPETTIQGNFKLVVVIKNQGNFPLFIEKLYITGNNIETISTVYSPYKILFLKSGETLKFNAAPTQLQLGTFTWRIYVDFPNYIKESDETNNFKDIQVTIK